MAVRPVVFNADGSIDVILDEMGHSGTIPAAEVVWAKNADGTDNHNLIALECPDGCGSVSIWPVGGGGTPVEGQQMFVHKTQRDGCACGQIAAGRTDAVPESHVRLNCSRMDGPQRWQASVTAQVETSAGGPPRIPIVYRQSDRLVVGEHPRGGVGPDHSVAVIAMAEYEILLRTEPAYLSADGEHILSSPPVGASV
jgi:hypothetical protein